MRSAHARPLTTLQLAHVRAPPAAALNSLAGWPCCSLPSDAQDRHSGPDMDGADEYIGSAGEAGEGFHFCGDPWPWTSSSSDSDDESSGERSPIVIRAAKRSFRSARGAAEKRARILYLHLVTSQGKWQTSPLLRQLVGSNSVEQHEDLYTRLVTDEVEVAVHMPRGLWVGALPGSV